MELAMFGSGRPFDQAFWPVWYRLLTYHCFPFTESNYLFDWGTVWISIYQTESTMLEVLSFMADYSCYSK